MSSSNSRPSFRVQKTVAHQFAGALLFAFVLGLSGCSDVPQGTGPGHREQVLALKPTQELELGREGFEQIRRQSMIIQSGLEVEQVEEIGRRIAKAVQIEPLQRELNVHVEADSLEWEYLVIEDRRVNAFCLPGGKICVYTGLIKLVQNDDQLAGVIAHEIAHALAHHVSERIAREQIAGKGLMSLPFDRSQELEADHIGVFLMTFAGYDPEEVARFWEQMETAQAGHVRLPELLSDHPSDRRRMERLREWVPLAEAAKKAFEEGRIAPAPRTRR